MSPDVRSPFVFDTHELGRRAGAMREMSRQFDLPEALGTDLVGVPAGAPFDMSVRLESVLEGVLVTGEARGTALGECSRCLDPLTLPINVTFQHLYTYPEKTEADDASIDDVSPLQDEHVDTQQPVTDGVVLALPFQPLCSSDCRGLCGQCGVRLAEHPEHSHEQTDPRLSVLEGLMADLTEREEKD